MGGQYEQQAQKDAVTYWNYCILLVFIAEVGYCLLHPRPRQPLVQV